MTVMVAVLSAVPVLLGEGCSSLRAARRHALALGDEVGDDQVLQHFRSLSVPFPLRQGPYRTDRVMIHEKQDIVKYFFLNYH